MSGTELKYMLPSPDGQTLAMTGHMGAKGCFLAFCDLGNRETIRYQSFPIRHCTLVIEGWTADSRCVLLKGGDIVSRRPEIILNGVGLVAAQGKLQTLIMKYGGFNTEWTADRKRYLFRVPSLTHPNSWRIMAVRMESKFDKPVDERFAAEDDRCEELADDGELVSTATSPEGYVVFFARAMKLKAGKQRIALWCRFPDDSIRRTCLAFRYVVR